MGFTGRAVGGWEANRGFECRLPAVPSLRLLPMRLIERASLGSHANDDG
jgi:hypothetical protein